MLMQMDAQMEKQFFERQFISSEIDVKKMLECAEKYNVLYKIFKGKLVEIQKKTEKETCYRRIGKKGGIRETLYPIDQMVYILVDNLKDPYIYKRQPKDMRGKEMYRYNKKGEVLLYTLYGEREGWINYEEAFFYLENYVLRVKYKMNMAGEEGWIGSIAIQKYENGLLVSSEWMEFLPEKGTGIGIHINRQEFMYSEGFMNGCSVIHYDIPTKTSTDIFHEYLKREEYLMANAEDGQPHLYAREETILEMCGEKIRNHYKRELRTKDYRAISLSSGRWNYPNYFENAMDKK